MDIQSAFNSGVASLKQATERASESASNIAQQQVTPPQNQTEVKAETANSYSQQGPVTDDIINLRVAENEANIAVTVIATADDVVGSLIDTRV